MEGGRPQTIPPTGIFGQRYHRSTVSSAPPSSCSGRAEPSVHRHGQAGQFRRRLELGWIRRRPRFDAAGAPVGPQLDVSTNTAGYKHIACGRRQRLRKFPGRLGERQRGRVVLRNLRRALRPPWPAPGERLPDQRVHDGSPGSALGRERRPRLRRDVGERRPGLAPASGSSGAGRISSPTRSPPTPGRRPGPRPTGTASWSPAKRSRSARMEKRDRCAHHRDGRHRDRSLRLGHGLRDSREHVGRVRIDRIGCGGSCNKVTPDACYRVSASGPRPATHWDGGFAETLSGGGGRFWTMHVGDSFADVPRSQPFYKKIETLLHNGITSGCTATTYCPGATVARDAMAIFIARGPRRRRQLVPSTPVSGGQLYDCSSGGHLELHRRRADRPLLQTRPLSRQPQRHSSAATQRSIAPARRSPGTPWPRSSPGPRRAGRRRRRPDQLHRSDDLEVVFLRGGQPPRALHRRARLQRLLQAHPLSLGEGDRGRLHGRRPTVPPSPSPATPWRSSSPTGSGCSSTGREPGAELCRMNSLLRLPVPRRIDFRRPLQAMAPAPMGVILETAAVSPRDGERLFSAARASCCRVCPAALGAALLRSAGARLRSAEFQANTYTTRRQADPGVASRRRRELRRRLGDSWSRAVDFGDLRRSVRRPRRAGRIASSRSTRDTPLPGQSPQLPRTRGRLRGRVVGDGGAERHRLPFRPAIRLVGSAGRIGLRRHTFTARTVLAETRLAFGRRLRRRLDGYRRGQPTSTSSASGSRCARAPNSGRGFPRQHLHDGQRQIPRIARWQCRPAGNFVVVWNSRSAQDGIGVSRRLRPAIQRSRRESRTGFPVNTYMTAPGPARSRWIARQLRRRLDERRQDGSGSGILGQRFDASGKRSGRSSRSTPTRPAIRRPGRRDRTERRLPRRLDSAADGRLVVGCLRRSDSTAGGARIGTDFASTPTRRTPRRRRRSRRRHADSSSSGRAHDQDGDGFGVFGRRQRSPPGVAHGRRPRHRRHPTGTGCWSPARRSSSSRTGATQGGARSTVTGTADAVPGRSARVHAARRVGALRNDPGRRRGRCNDGTPDACYAVQSAGTRPGNALGRRFQEDLCVGGGADLDAPRRRQLLGRAAVAALLQEDRDAAAQRHHVRLHRDAVLPGRHRLARPDGDLHRQGHRRLGELVPAAGTVGASAYNCSPGGHSLFTDVVPDRLLLQARPLPRRAERDARLQRRRSTARARPSRATRWPPSSPRPSSRRAAAPPSRHLHRPVTGAPYSCVAGSPNLHFTDVRSRTPSASTSTTSGRGESSTGCTATTYCPSQPVARDAMAKFIANGFGLQLYGP